MTAADLIAFIKKHPIGTACVLICLGCGVNFYFRSDAVDEARKDYDAVSKEDQRISNDIRNAVGLQQHLDAMQADARQLDGRLVRATQLASNLQYFYRMESETGVKLLDVRQMPLPSLRPGAARTQYSPVPFVITIQGGYKQIMDFLARLEKGQRFCRFTQVNFNKNVQGQQDVAAANPLNVSMNIEMLGTP